MEGPVKAEDCMGLTSRRAGRYLRGLAKEVPSDQAIVEIGVYTGRSLLYLAEGSLAGNGAKVYGIDPWNLPRASKPKYKDSKTYAYAMNAIQMSDAAHLIVPIRSYGTVIAENWDGPKVGLVYIDADHRYLPVLEDYYAWKPHLAEGAIIAFDDYDLATFPGVVQAVDELAALDEIAKPKIVADRMAVSMWVPSN